MRGGRRVPLLQPPGGNAKRTGTAACAADQIRGSPPEDTDPNVGSILCCWADSGLGAVALWRRRVQGRALVRTGGGCLVAFNCVRQDRGHSFSRVWAILVVHAIFELTVLVCGAAVGAYPGHIFLRCGFKTMQEPEGRKKPKRFLRRLRSTWLAAGRHLLTHFRCYHSRASWRCWQLGKMRAVSRNNGSGWACLLQER
jgi:hypothetical protein